MKKKTQHIEEVDIEYMTDTSAAMMQGIPRRYHLILWGAITFLIVAAIWADHAVLDEVTKGDGKVIPSSNIQVVQNLEGGIVKDLRVRTGDIVERDQILMVIDDTRFASSFNETQVQIATLQAKVARLTAESTGKELVIPDALQANYPAVVQSEENLYRSRVQELEVQLNILEDQENQKQQELLELQGRQDQLQRSYELVKKELELTKPLVKEGAVSEVDLLRLERTVNDLKGELEANKLSIPRLQSALQSATRKIKELQISFKTEALGLLNDAKSELSRLTESQSALEDRVKRTLVRSPVRGTINQIKVNTIGGIIQPGQDIFEIVPLEDTLLIEANIRPQDIGFLRPGLPAIVKITAYDFSIHGGLKATVEHISADTITNDRGDSFYQIRVRTEENTLKSGGKELPIIPGMGATVDILTGQKTVLDYILKPILKTKQSALRER